LPGDHAPGIFTRFFFFFFFFEAPCRTPPFPPPAPEFFFFGRTRYPPVATFYRFFFSRVGAHVLGGPSQREVPLILEQRKKMGPREKSSLQKGWNAFSILKMTQNPRGPSSESRFCFFRKTGGQSGTNLTRVPPPPFTGPVGFFFLFFFFFLWGQRILPHPRPVLWAGRPAPVNRPKLLPPQARFFPFSRLFLSLFKEKDRSNAGAGLGFSP